MFCFLIKSTCYRYSTCGLCQTAGAGLARGECPTGQGPGWRLLSSLLSPVPLVGRWAGPQPKQALSKPALAPHTQVEIFSHWLDLTRDRRVSLELHDTGNVNNCSIINSHNLQILWYGRMTHDLRDLHTIKNDKTHLGYSCAWQACPLHNRSLLRLSVPDLQHGRVQQILAQPRHHWSGKVQGGKMDRAEFPLSVSAMSWSAPGKNTVDHRNYVATPQPRDRNNDWQLP